MSDDRTDLAAALDALLRFGAAMMHAGDTAFRVRDSMSLLARAMGIEDLAVQVTIGGVGATARRGRETATLMREIGPPGIDAQRIVSLEKLAQTSRPGITPRQLAAELDALERARPHYPIVAVAGAIGLASASFSYLNGGDALGTVAAAIAGGAGQAVRALLFARRLNQFAVTALCAMLTAGLYCALVAGLAASGFGPGHAAGFIFSVLFLVPGFPLVAGLLDSVQHQTMAAVGRLSYAAMILLAAAIGLSAVAAIAGIAVTPALAQPSGIEPLPLILRALASFAGGVAFAVLYNSPFVTLLVVGAMSLAGNELRLALHDLGMALAPATFLGALLVGLIATLARRHLHHHPRIVLTVPSIIIMTPGLFAFQAIVMVNQGEVQAAIAAGANCGFIVGAMAMGLVAARFLTERRWLVER
ncbi:MAG: threonine/serine exporter family protein [Reyranellaceae bacterium]